ncbi:MAG TPA: TlpA disulfide reductase family protein [Terriglobales bacterium]|nr:TlpA disulfide reductase family protein [Terriglobales bacterium]
MASTAGESRRMPIGKSSSFCGAVQNLAISPRGGDADDRIATRGLRVLVTMVLASCALLSQAQAQRQTNDESGKLSSLLGKPAPPFAVTTLDGKAVSLSDFKGKTLIVNFWATWCGNCKVEMPWLAQLREQYASQGFEVLGILTNNAPPEKIAAIRQKYNVKYPILMCNHKTAQAYGGLPDLPESFFIDRRGRIVAEMDGADSEEEIENNIRKALGRR